MHSIVGSTNTRMNDASRETESAADWAASRSIRAYGVRVGIRTNKPELLDRILDHAPPLWQPTSGPCVERTFSFRFGTGSSRNRGSSHVLSDSLEDPVRSRRLDTILDVFRIRLKLYVAEMARRRVFVHSGAVAWQGKAIILPGRSMSGKTSLVAELVRAGATYYSDEYAVLDSQGRLHPYPQPLQIRKAGSVKQQECPAEEIGGVTGTRPLPVGLVVVSRHEVGACWRPQLCSAGQAILELLGNTVPARRKPEVVIPTLQRTVSEATVLKGVRGEAKETARLILQRLSSV